MRERVSHLLKALCFAGLVAGILALFSIVLAPLVSDWNTWGDSDETLAEFYKLPEDSVEVVFIGTSTFQNGLSPERLEEKFGVSSYNLGTWRQTAVISYYMLKEALRTQGGSLSAVVLDARGYLSPVAGRNGEGSTRRADMEHFLLNMAWSPNKVECMRDALGLYDELDPIELLVPAFRYHSRWSELSSADVERAFGKIDSDLVKGQACLISSNELAGRAGAYTREKNAKITEDIERSGEEIESSLDGETMDYLGKTVDLCRENGVDVVLAKTPDSNWGNKNHDRVAYLAKKFDLDFIDFAAPEVMDSCGLSYDADFVDYRHLNVGGSVKATDFVGDYLVEHFGLGSSFEGALPTRADADSARFHDYLDDASLAYCVRLEEYLDLIDRERYTVFVSVKGEAIEGLSNGAREKLNELGCKKLVKLKAGGSYVGVIDGGACLKEVSDDSGNEAILSGSYKDGVVSVRELHMQDGAKLSDPFDLSSIGSESKAISSISVGTSNLSENKRGINFVVFDNVTGAKVDNSSFDTHVGSARTSDLGRG